MAAAIRFMYDLNARRARLTGKSAIDAMHVCATCHNRDIGAELS
jgi:cytochrome c553